MSMSSFVFYNLKLTHLIKKIKHKIIDVPSPQHSASRSYQGLRCCRRKIFENQIRKLILVKCQVEKMSINNQKLNLKNTNLNLFKQTILPKVLSHDEQIKAQMEAWKEYLSETGVKEKISISNDLFLASNPQNIYPVFQIFQKSENFSFNELQHALIFLSDLDYR